MAKIQEYSAQATPSTENNFKEVATTPYETIANVGETMESIGKSVREKTIALQKSKADLAAATNSAAMEMSIASMSKSFDPNDPDAMNEILKPFRDSNAKFRESLGSDEAKEYFDRNAALHETKFTQLALTRNSALQSQELSQNLEARYNALAESVSNNPGLLSAKLSELYASRDSLLPLAGRGGEGKVDKLLQETALKLNREAADSEIISNPFKVDLSKYTLGDKTNEFKQKLKLSQNAAEVQADRNDRAMEKAKKERAEAVNQDFLARQVNGTLSTEAIMKSPDLTYEQKKTWIKELDRKNSKSLDVDPELKARLFDRIMLNPEDPDSIQDSTEITQSSLSPKDKLDLVANMNQAKTSDPADFSLRQSAFNQVKKSLVRPDINGIPDQLGNKKYMEFVSVFNREYDAGIKAGKTPHQLLGAGQKDNIIDRLIPMYTPTLQEAVQSELKRLQQAKRPKAYKVPETTSWTGSGMSVGGDLGNGSSTPAPAPTATPPENARKPGETTQQYRKRMGF